MVVRGSSRARHGPVRNFADGDRLYWPVSFGDAAIPAAIMLGFIGVGGGLFNIPLNAWAAGSQSQIAFGRHSCGWKPADISGDGACGRSVLAVARTVAVIRSQHLSRVRVGHSANSGLCRMAASAGHDPFSCVVAQSICLPRSVYDLQNLPETGPALLVANHVTWIDGVLILLASSRPIRWLPTQTM